MFNFFKNKKNTVLKAPFEGEVVDITKVDDQVFSSKMLGDGIAIIPTSNKALAPCDGKLTNIFPTNHAFGIETKEGLEILVHIGLDTVELKGEGFKRLIEEGTTVKAGDAVIEVDFQVLKSNKKDTITPLVITNMDKIKEIKKDYSNLDEVISLQLN